MLTYFHRASLGAIVVATLTTQAVAGKIEVLHWWTSGGEKIALSELKTLMEAQGHEWRDFAVSGGGGGNAMTVLKSRTVSGYPPSAAQVKAMGVAEWAKRGYLINLDEVADAEQWDKSLPPLISERMKHQGHYVAVPINIHRINWLWANPKVFEAVGVSIPVSWSDFFTAAEAIKKAGFVALAHGGQPWQNATLFEDMVLGIGGVDFYKKALIALDPDALNSVKMVEILTAFKRLKNYMDPAFLGRQWHANTQMLIRDEAAMQIMGDWVKGEFNAVDKKPKQDYLCVPSPGTQGAFIFSVDSMIMFDTQQVDNKNATKDLAKTLLQPAFQRAFNLNKGSIPVRMDLSLDGFDSCAELAHSDFRRAEESGTLLPSMTHEMAVLPSVRAAIVNTINHFFNSKTRTATETAEELERVVKQALFWQYP